LLTALCFMRNCAFKLSKISHKKSIDGFALANKQRC
jgi:hypothetical protein